MTTQINLPPSALDQHAGTPSPATGSTPGPTPAGTSADARPSRRWAVAGLAAGLTSLGALVSAFGIDAVYDPDLDGDPQLISEKLGDLVPQIIAFHVLGTLSAVLLVVFAAGLHRRLRATAGPDSTAPLVAFGGLLGTAVVMVLGTGLDTELVFAVGHEKFVTADNQAFYNTWVGTIWWCWVLAGLSAVAVWVASRNGGVPRWLGRAGLVGGSLTLLLGIAPQQYIAGMIGPIALLVASIGFLVGDRAYRAGA